MLENTADEVNKDNTLLASLVHNVMLPWTHKKLKTLFLFCIELEESKGGKGRDSGERGPLFEDREGHEGSEGHQATDTNLHQAAGAS